MAKAEVINYTENELKAIKALEGAKAPATAKELGVTTAVLESLIKKSNDPRPMAEGVERVMVVKSKDEGRCPTCGQPYSHTLYALSK